MREPLNERPVPPFDVGRRVRCRAHFHTPDPYSRTDLYGRAGTVVAVAWDHPAVGQPRWVVRVDYDHLGQLTGPQNSILHLEAGDLVPTEEW